MSNATGVQAVYEQYTELFVTNKPIVEQFVIYFVRNVFSRRFRLLHQSVPRTVSDVIQSSVWWTVALQFPAIIVGWILGNTLGALAAYLRKGFDTKSLCPISIFLSNLPAFGMAVILLVMFGSST